MRTKQKNSIDWHPIREQWGCKTFSNRALAKLFSVDEKSIRTRAKREGWKRFAQNESAYANQVRTDRKPDAWPTSNVSPTSSALAEDIDPAQLAMAGRDILGKLAKELLEARDGRAELIAEVLTAYKRGERHPRTRALLIGLASLGTRCAGVRNLASSIGLLANAGGGKKARAHADAEQAADGDVASRRKPN